MDNASQVVVDLDIFEMMENFQGNLYMMSKNKTVLLDNDSLHILVMGRERGQEAIDHLQVGHSQDCRLYNCRDGLETVRPGDNRREINQKGDKSTSIYDGVYVASEKNRKDRWKARANIDGIQYHIYESSKNEVQVANAYQIICENLAAIRKALVNPECDTPAKKRKRVQSLILSFE